MNPYEVLGVPENASEEETEKAGTMMLSTNSKQLTTWLLTTWNTARLTAV